MRAQSRWMSGLSPSQPRVPPPYSSTGATPRCATIAGHLGVEPELEYAGGTRGWLGDSPLIHLDCGRIRELGWRPTLTIPEGIRRTIDWLQENPWALEERPAA